MRTTYKIFVLIAAMVVAAGFGQIANAQIAVTPAGPVALGNVNTGSVMPTDVVVSNPGAVPLVITAAPTGVTLAGDPDYSIGADTCSGATLNQNQTCIVEVRYLPAAAVAANATLTILSDDAVTPTFNLAFSGTGSDAQVFADVLPGNFFENHINSLFNANITTGIGGGLYGGEQNVSRDQMAAFLVRAVEGDPPPAITINVPLTGAAQNPPVITAATGTAAMTVNLATGVISGTITFSGIASGITDAHIHEAPVGVNGGVVVPFSASVPIGQQAGTIPITGTLTPALLNSLAAGNLYFNLHSVANAGGEIRGQIPSPQQFSDVVLGNFFFTHIDRLADLGVTTGFPDGTYRPADLVSRDQMAAFIVRAVDGIEPTVCDPLAFTDVAADNFFCPHITRLRDLGVTTGFQDGTYRPGGLVTRQEMAAFLARAFLGLP